MRERDDAPVMPRGDPLMDGEVSGLRAESAWGGRLLAVKVKMTNQDGAVLAEGPCEVEVPL